MGKVPDIRNKVWSEASVEDGTEARIDDDFHVCRSASAKLARFFVGAFILSTSSINCSNRIGICGTGLEFVTRLDRFRCSDGSSWAGDLRLGRFCGPFASALSCPWTSSIFGAMRWHCASIKPSMYSVASALLVSSGVIHCNLPFGCKTNLSSIVLLVVPLVNFTAARIPTDLAGGSGKSIRTFSSTSKIAAYIDDKGFPRPVS